VTRSHRRFVRSRNHRNGATDAATSSASTPSFGQPPSLHNCSNPLVRTPPVEDIQFAGSDFLLLTALLAKELVQSNLQVLKDALLCTEGLVGTWLVPSPWRDLVHSSVSGACEEVSGLLVALLQSIRHSNRGVALTATAILRTWFAFDADDCCQSLKLSHGCLLLRLVCVHFQEAVKRKPVSIDVLLRWLADLLNLTALRWTQFLRAGTAQDIFDPVSREEMVKQLSQTLSQVVRHRDEKTREAALVLAGNLLALDTLWLQLGSSPPLHSILSLAIPTSLPLLLEAVSPTLADVVKGLSKEPAWRRHEGQLLESVDHFLRRLTMTDNR
jgi:hypothetical protein